MSQRTGPYELILEEISIPDTNAHAMTAFRAQGNSIKLMVVTSGGGGCVSLTFTCYISEDTGLTYGQVIKSGAAWSAVFTTPTTAGRYFFDLPDLDIIPGCYVKLYYQAASASGKLEVTAINWDNERVAAGGNVSTGIATGAGAVSSATTRVVLSSDDAHLGAVGAAADVDGNIHGQLRYVGEAIDTRFGSVGAAADVDGVVHGQLRYIGEAIDTRFGSVGAASDVDGVVHGQLRYIGDSTDAITTAVNNHNGTLGEASDIDGTIHGQLRYIADSIDYVKTAVEIMDDWDDAADHCETVNPYKPQKSVATGTGAISLSCDPSVPFRVDHITLHLSAAGTTSEYLTVTLDATDAAAYDTILHKVDLSVGAVTDYVIPGSILPQEFVSGDKILVAWPNTEGRTYGARVVWRQI